MSETNAARTRIETSRKVIAILQEKYEVKHILGGFYFYINFDVGTPPLPIICQLTEEDVILSAMLIYSGEDSSWSEDSTNGFGSVAEKLNLQLLSENYRYALVKTLRHHNIFGDCVSASQIIEYPYISDLELSKQIHESVESLKRLYSKFISYWDNKEYKKEYKMESTNGCYIATCVYGSYDCPQVWTLRRYRDNTLANTWYGKAFIRTYYAISPTLVKWFGHTNWFKKLWVGTLNKMVKSLQANGVESTPYEDKKW